MNHLPNRKRKLLLQKEALLKLKNERIARNENKLTVNEKKLDENEKNLDATAKKLDANERMLTLKLDEINKLLLFHPLYLETIATTRSPRFEPLFASMGITVAGERVQLQTVGPGARLRSQISDRKNL